MRCTVPVVLSLVCATAMMLLPTGSMANEPTPPEGFRALFNGKDLTGWYGLNPHGAVKLTGEKKEANLAKQRADFPNHWRVENGELVNDGHGPYATTEEDLGNIELLIEYKTVPKADSGIYLRGTPQVQIWDWNQTFNPKNPNRKPHQGSGGLFNNTPNTLGRDPMWFVDKPFGEWNQLRIRQVGARTWVWLNTRPVVEGAIMENYWDRSQPLPSTGPIMLQTHGGEIRWRNIFVREFSDEESAQYLESPMLPNPTHYDVAYGPHGKQVMHFWQAKSDQPTPVMFFIHGGGWMNGARLFGLSPILQRVLDSGISVVSVEYRFTQEAKAAGIVPPVKAPMEDVARALQLVRSKATEWNIDKERIGAAGASAGGCSSLWLAFHDDMADPDSDDPIAHESTRLWCAAVDIPQTTLDPQQMREWTPNSFYGGHAFGFAGGPEKSDYQFDEFLAKRESILPWIAEYSPYEHVSSDDPPVALYFSTPPALGKPEKDPTHTANFGVKLQEHCQANGVDCDLVFPGAQDVTHSSAVNYLIWKLKQPASE